MEDKIAKVERIIMIIVFLVGLYFLLKNHTGLVVTPGPTQMTNGL